MSNDNVFARQCGGTHYLGLGIQPAEYWIKNQLPAVEGAVVKYVTRHRKKNGVVDIDKAKHFVEMLIWWYFDAPADDRAVPQHWRGHRNFVIRPKEYCEANALPPQESAIIALVCDFSAREHFEVALSLLEEIRARDYATEESQIDRQDPMRSLVDGMTGSDDLYLAKTYVERYVELCEVTCVPVTKWRGARDLIGRLAARLRAWSPA